MSRRRPSRFHGLLPIFKKAGPTSHDVVDMARKALGERRIGHTGTLDPLAEGLLLLCVGQATRLQQFLLKWNKTYEGLVRLGFATTTYDTEGDPTEPRGEVPAINPQVLADLESRFCGEIQQVPPAFSAKKVGGKKLYELARSGEDVSPEPKTVRVESIEMTAREDDLLAVKATTSTGFYVRSLAHDIGLALGCGAHLDHLRRTAIGPYEAAQALSQDDLQAAESAAEIVEGKAWIPLERVELAFPDVGLNPAATERIVHGQEVVVFSPGIEGLSSGSNVVLRDTANQVLGIGTVRAVLARGRTLNIAPTMVLDTQSAGSRPRK